MGEKINALESWKVHFYALSSRFNIKKKVNRDLVDYIYLILTEFWGKEFFETDFLDAVHENKIYFLHSLLGQPSFSSFYYLLEVALLLDHAKNHERDLYVALQFVKEKSEQSKDILFEIYIAHTFYRSNLPYATGIIEGNQPKDGVCVIENQHFLVECKKRYSVLEKEIDLRTHLMASILKTAKKTTYGLECIGVVTIKAENTNKQLFAPMLKAFKNYMVNRNDYLPRHIIEDENIRLELKEYNDANRIELESSLIPCTIYFTIQNLNTIKDDKLQFRVQLHFKTFTNRKKVADKLIASIKAARKQHKQNENEPRIFFIDNEFLNDFSTPLLHNLKVYENHLKEYLESKKTDDVVVLLYRNYTGNAPSIKVSVICKESLRKIKEAIEKINFYTVDQSKMNT